MNYPLISEYVQAIKLSEENFDKLTNLRPVLDVDGNPIMSSGNFAVVFKMQDKQTGKLYAVKCFLREQEGREESYKLISSELEYLSSGFLVSVRYLEKELFVDTTQGNDTEFPVLIMDWVEGTTLDKYIRNNIHNRYNLSLVTYQFCRMASWLLSQEFAHGDLKPDNIIVREDGQLVLVDYDGMFVSAMKGQKARELGSVDYRHPLRNEDKFDSTIDHFSIASIALSLKAISLKPELLNEFGAEDRLLFSAKDYQNLGDSDCIKAINSLSNDVELAQLLGLFYIAYARNELAYVSFRLFNIVKPEYVPVFIPEVELSTEVTDEDLENAIVDEYGVKYSQDGKKLLRSNFILKTYIIRKNTKIICNNAFQFCESLQQIIMPDSVTIIGESAFLGCHFLQQIIMPSSVTIIGKSAFLGCGSLQQITIPDSVTTIEDSAFSGCISLQQIIIPETVKKIGEASFADCDSLKIVSNNDRFIVSNNMFFIDEREKRLIKCLTDIPQIIIPDSVEIIGCTAFSKCKSLRQIKIPSSVKIIGNSAFSGCISLQQITIPESVAIIGNRAFHGCRSLRQISISNSVKNIGNSAFEYCISLQHITIPDSVTTIEHSVFKNCVSLQQVTISKSLESIGARAFEECISLQHITIPNSVTIIEHSAFSWCKSLRHITIPNSVTKIGDEVFGGCESLQQITLPESVIIIGDKVFCSCISLQRIKFPSNLLTIVNYVLGGCKSLQSIKVPKGQSGRFKDSLKNLGIDLSIVQEIDD